LVTAGPALPREPRKPNSSDPPEGMVEFHDIGVTVEA
jgi:hypothetical protein